MLTRKNTDVLRELVPLAGKAVLDVGCGDGALAIFMAGQGAQVIGLESNPRRLTRGRTAAADMGVSFCSGIAQDLPIRDRSLDVVVYSNSLHHVPVADQPRALAEAARVLKAGGLVYVSEPLAEGSFFAAVKLIDDETFVRAKALEAIRAAAKGLEPVAEVFYGNARRFSSYEEFRDAIVAVDPARSPIAARHDAELRQSFRTNAVREGDRWRLDQPMRANLLRLA